MQFELRCNNIIRYHSREQQPLMIIRGSPREERCEGLLTLRERIVHPHGVDYVYQCMVCQKVKIIFGGLEDNIEVETRKAPSVLMKEEKYLEEHR